MTDPKAQQLIKAAFLVGEHPAKYLGVEYNYGVRFNKAIEGGLRRLCKKKKELKFIAKYSDMVTNTMINDPEWLMQNRGEIDYFLEKQTKPINLTALGNIAELTLALYPGDQQKQKQVLYHIMRFL
jgi:hypothetical protein